MEEIWVPIVTWMNGIKYSFVGFYEISNLGRIRSVEHLDNLGRVRKSTIKKTQRGKSNYRITNLCTGGVNKTFSVHKCVWESFNGQIPYGYQINHINEDKTDNRLENLNLMTPKENTNWGSRTDRQTETQKNRPDLSKKVYQYGLHGNLIKVWPSAKEVQRVLGYPNTNITNCCNKAKHYEKQYAYGYIWKREAV